MILIARNPEYIETPADVQAAVRNAMSGKQYEAVDELAETIPELKDKTEGEVNQVLSDSGMELVIDDTVPVDSDPVPDPEPPV